MKKVEKLVKAFKLTGLVESERIELDNLDRARLVYGESGEVVVENEHCTEFPVSDLSNMELDIFLANVGKPISSLAQLKESYIERCIDENKVDDYDQLCEEIDNSVDYDDFLQVIGLWSGENIDERFKRVFGIDTKKMKKILVVSK
jgi:hypothetical protein